MSLVWGRLIWPLNNPEADRAFILPLPLHQASVLPVFLSYMERKQVGIERGISQTLASLSLSIRGPF